MKLYPPRRSFQINVLSARHAGRSALCVPAHSDRERHVARTICVLCIQLWGGMGRRKDIYLHPGRQDLHSSFCASVTEQRWEGDAPSAWAQDDTDQLLVQRELVWYQTSEKPETSLFNKSPVLLLLSKRWHLTGPASISVAQDKGTGISSNR